MQADSFTLATSPFPFSDYRDIRSIEHGVSVEEMITGRFGPELLLYSNLKVFINGEFLPRAEWGDTYPLPAQVVNIRAVPMGGGGGKSPLATVLAVVVTLAAPGIGSAIGLGALNAGIGLTAAQGIFLGKAAAFAFSAVAKLAIGAIAKPPKPKSAARSFTNNAAESPTLFIEGARNAIDRYGPVGLNLGTNRVFPKQAATPFTTLNGDVQEVRHLFTYGHADECYIDELRIGETLLEQFNGVTLEHRLNGDLNNSTSIYSNDVFQDNLSTLVSKEVGFVTRTAQPAADELVLEFTFDRGLAEYNDQGERLAREVVLDAQYAPTGTTDWSSGYESYNSYPAETITPFTINARGANGASRFRKDIVVLDINSGELMGVEGTQVVREDGLASLPYPATPDGRVLICSYTVEQDVSGAFTTHNIIDLIDNRDPAFFGQEFETSGDFLPTVGAGFSVDIAAGAIRFRGLSFKESRSGAFKRSIKFILPSNGQYDVRVQRITDDTDSDQILDTVFFSSLKSIAYQSPVDAENLCGTAMVIQATEQLNGAVEEFNCIMSSAVPDYDAVTDEWVTRPTSNPASLYRYILQGSCNSEPVSDAEIDIPALEAWHTYCDSRGYEYNYFIDYEATVNDLLQDIASAGAGSMAIIDGLYTVVVDNEKDSIVQMVTPSNSWGYKGSMIYDDIPHAFRVTFRNKEKGYRTDEIIVFDDGYTADNAVTYEALEFITATNADLAYKMARRYLASIRLRPETHKFYMDVENLVATRGDRIVLVNDVPLIGIGDGHILSMADDGSNITSITIDKELAFLNETYSCRIRLQNQTYLVEPLNMSAGDSSVLVLSTPLPLASAPDVGDLVSVFETGEELDLMITEIRSGSDLSAEISAVNYAPEIFNADSGVIPPFVSNITLPFELRRPEPPIITSIQSDESVMAISSDGTYQSRMVINLENSNGFEVIPVITARESGTDTFSTPDIVSASANKLVITGLQDGRYYDFRIFYRNQNGANLISAPNIRNSEQYVGASGLPADVSGFLFSEASGVATFRWQPNTDIDLSHYIIRYAAVYSGATWITAQTLEDNIIGNSYSTAFLGGTYFIKAVDRLGNESENATAIITYNPGNIRNVVQTIQESPDFLGSKSNCIAVGGGLQLASTSSEGIYTFNTSSNLGGVATAFVSAAIQASGTFINNVYDMDDLFSESDIFGTGGADIFAADDIYDIDDLFGIESGSWAVGIEIRTTQDDPSGSPAWSEWSALQAGNYSFWGAEFRLRLTSLSADVSPYVSGLTVIVDMPDRIVKAEDVTSPVGGLTVSYSADHGGDFQANPSVNITIQDGESDDKLEYTTKTKAGFSVKVFNVTAGAYVERMLDYTVIGYGKVF